MENNDSVTWLKEKTDFIKKVDYSTELMKGLEERIFILKAQTEAVEEKISNSEARTNQKISILNQQVKEFMNLTNNLFTQSEQKAEHRHKALTEELCQKDEKISLLQEQVSSLLTGCFDVSQGICAEEGNTTPMNMKRMRKRRRKLTEAGSDQSLYSHSGPLNSPSNPSSPSTTTSTTTATTTTATTSCNSTRYSSSNTFNKNIADQEIMRVGSVDSASNLEQLNSGQVMPNVVVTDPATTIPTTDVTTSSLQKNSACVEGDSDGERFLCTTPDQGQMYKNINGISYHRIVGFDSSLEVTDAFSDTHGDMPGSKRVGLVDSVTNIEQLNSAQLIPNVTATDPATTLPTTDVTTSRWWYEKVTYSSMNRYACHCGKAYKKLNQLSRHQRTEHEHAYACVEGRPDYRGEDRFVCCVPMCNQLYTTMGSIIHHLSIDHHEYACYCGKAYKQQSLLSHHQTTEHGHSPCPAAASDTTIPSAYIPTNSYYHGKFTHVVDDRGRKRVQCTFPECGEMFKKINDIKYHWQLSHHQTTEHEHIPRSATASDMAAASPTSSIASSSKIDDPSGAYSSVTDDVSKDNSLSIKEEPPEHT